MQLQWLLLQLCMVVYSWCWVLSMLMMLWVLIWQLILVVFSEFWLEMIVWCCVWICLMLVFIVWCRLWVFCIIWWCWFLWDCLFWLRCWQDLWIWEEVRLLLQIGMFSFRLIVCFLIYLLQCISGLVVLLVKLRVLLLFFWYWVMVSRVGRCLVLCWWRVFLVVLIVQLLVSRCRFCCIVVLIQVLVLFGVGGIIGRVWCMFSMVLQLWLVRVIRVWKVLFMCCLVINWLVWVVLQLVWVLSMLVLLERFMLKCLLVWFN